MQFKKRRGLTLIELLTSCVCCSIIAALALPAIQMSRDEADVLECATQLRTIAIAAHNYHDSHKRFTGTTLGAKGVVNKADWLKKSDKNADHYWQNNQNTNSLAMLLPYMEQARVAEQVDPFNFDFFKGINKYVDARGNQVYKWQGDIHGVTKTAQIAIAGLTCPSDNINNVDLDAIIIASQPCQNEKTPEEDLGVMSWPNNDANKFMRTNYLANGGAGAGQCLIPGEQFAFQGPMLCRQKSRLETVRDGTSNTILYGETLGEINDGKRTKAMAWMWGGHGRGRGAIPWGKATDPDNNKKRILGDANWSSVYGFGSKHELGVNFVHADASVHNYVRDIDQKTLYSLYGANDGRRLEKVKDNLHEIRQREKMARLKPRNETEKAILADELLSQDEKMRFIDEYRRMIRRKRNDQNNQDRKIERIGDRKKTASDDDG